ncbi:MGMT family protein [Candidatus Collierbacteria bacterium]|nr:MGMT family protein [Candidatus Collierbacteria bacterium]
MTDFFQQVYALTSKVPKGKVTTYGTIAKSISTRNARRVGHALHSNKNSRVPCHRVVFANGSLAPGYAFGGPTVQKKKLLSEGVGFTTDGKVDLNRFFFQLGDFKQSENIPD